MATDTNLNFILEAQNRVTSEITKIQDSLKGLETSQKDVAAANDKSTLSFGKLTGGIALGNMISNAASSAFQGVKDQLGDLFTAADDDARAVAQLGAAIQSTGGAAGVTAQSAIDLAENIQKTTPIAHETALTMEDMLLTFTSITKDVFPQTAAAVTDMATRMNGGLTPSAQQLSTTAIQVGKALQDPIKGITALHKVGVEFTDQQKEQVKAMMAVGDQTGAQKLILAELSKEFGGSASAALDTFAGKQQQTANIMEDAKAQLGDALEKGLLPFQQALASFVSSDQFKAWIVDLTKFIQDLSKNIVDATKFYQAHADIINSIAIVMGTLVGTILTVIEVMKIVAAVQKAWTGIMFVFNAVMDANPIALIIIGITALIAIVILMATHWKQVTSFFSDGVKIITAAFNDSVNFIKSIWNDVASWFEGIINSIVGFFGVIWTGVTAVFKNVMDFIKKWGLTIVAVIFFPFSIALGLIIMFWKPITAFFTTIWNAIVAIFTPVVQFFGFIFKAAVDIIVAVFTAITSWFTNKFNEMVLGLKIIVGIIALIFVGLWDAIVAIFTPVVKWFGDVFTGAWNAIKSVFGAVGGFFGGIWNTIVNIFGKIGSSVGDAIGGAFKGAINGVLDFAVGMINGFIGAIDTAIDVVNHIPGVSVPKLSPLPVPHLAGGTSDFVGGMALLGEQGPEMAYLPPGTQVTPAAQTAKIMNAASGGASGNQSVSLTISIGMYAGMPSEKRAIAVEMYRELTREARAHGVQLPQIGSIGVQ